MTLEQRRRRLSLGLAICAVANFGLVAAWLGGVSRHFSLIASMPLWLAIAVLSGQLISIREKIAVQGPDALEVEKPRSRKALVVAIASVVVVLAIGVIIAARIPN